MYTVQVRRLVVVNTDPQRRCYDGAHFSSEVVWSKWQDVATYPSLADASDTVLTFKSINPTRQYCISQE